MFRRWLTLLICLFIPLQGWAVAPAPGTPCPMAEQMVAALTQTLAAQAAAPPRALVDDSAAAGDDAPAFDCCNDLNSFAQTGQACKTGQECQAQAFTLGVPQSNADRAAAATGKLDGAVHRANTPPGWPASVWRPPNLH